MDELAVTWQEASTPGRLVVSALDHCVQQGPHLQKDMRSQLELPVPTQELDRGVSRNIQCLAKGREKAFNLVNPLTNSLPEGQPSARGHGSLLCVHRVLSSRSQYPVSVSSTKLTEGQRTNNPQIPKSVCHVS